LLITQIADRNGRVLEAFATEPERVLDRALVERLVDVMRGVVQTGTATALRSDWGVRGDLAGKTGTTQNNTDGWFMLMSPTLVSGAWVGFNDPRVTMRSNQWGQGGHNALRIVGAFMQQGQKAGLIDEKAEFPQVARELPLFAEPASAPEAPIDVPGNTNASANAPLPLPLPSAAPATQEAPGAGIARWLGLSPTVRPTASAASAAEAAAEKQRLRDQALGR
jgi:penicillin-binding protein 1A